MRKPRKVIADVLAMTTSPPPSLPTEKHPVPMCLFCDGAPVKLLGYLHSPGPEPKAFCCTICAASYALTAVKRRLLTWCAAHGKWSDDSGECKQCWIETEAARRNAYIKATTAQAGEGTVNRDK